MMVITMYAGQEAYISGYEINPPKDTLATTETDGWIEEGGDINTEMEIIRDRMDARPQSLFSAWDGFIVNR